MINEIKDFLFMQKLNQLIKLNLSQAKLKVKKTIYKFRIVLECKEINFETEIVVELKL